LVCLFRTLSRILF